jgi:hypothetical protein
MVRATLFHTVRPQLQVCTVVTLMTCEQGRNGEPRQMRRCGRLERIRGRVLALAATPVDDEDAEPPVTCAVVVLETLKRSACRVAVTEARAADPVATGVVNVARDSRSRAAHAGGRLRPARSAPHRTRAFRSVARAHADATCGRCALREDGAAAESVAVIRGA